MEHEKEKMNNAANHHERRLLIQPGANGTQIDSGPPSTILANRKLESLAFNGSSNNGGTDQSHHLIGITDLTTLMEPATLQKIQSMRLGQSCIVPLTFPPEKVGEGPFSANYLVRILQSGNGSMEWYHLFTLVNSANQEKPDPQKEPGNGKPEKRAQSAGMSNEEHELYNELLRFYEIVEHKSRFISMMSHEFRTPLASIQSACDILDGYNGQLTEEMRKDKLDRIQKSIRRLTDLLDDVLDLSKAESGTLDIQHGEHDISALIEQIVDELREAGKIRNHRLRIHRGADIERPFTTDVRFLEHIIYNLLSNALKYTPDGDEVDLSVMRKDDKMKLIVADSGIGIPLDDQVRLFQPFYRATNVGAVRGSGLGLSIIDRFVRLLKGQIEFESFPGAGTTFIVTIPEMKKLKGVH